MGSFCLVVFISAEKRKEKRMNIKIFLACSLACMFAAPALATFPIIIASGTGAAATTATISGGAVLLGALGATILKAGILRELTRRRSSRMHYSPRRSYRHWRGKREAVPDIEELELLNILNQLNQLNL